MQVPRGIQRTSTNRSCGLIASPFSRKGKRTMEAPIRKRLRHFACCLRVCAIFSGRRWLDCPPLFANRFFGGHEAAVRPDPIPNSAVKRCIADGSACIARARVGCRRFFLGNGPGTQVPGPFAFVSPAGAPDCADSPYPSGEPHPTGTAVPR